MLSLKEYLDPQLERGSRGCSELPSLAIMEGIGVASNRIKIVLPQNIFCFFSNTIDSESFPNCPGKPTTRKDTDKCMHM